MRDPYLFTDADILQNKLNIKESKLLSEAEMQFIIVRFLSLDEQMQNSDLNKVAAIKKIHKLLFGDIYDWAGEFRKINIQKSERVLDGLSVEYCDYTRINEKMTSTLDHFSKVNWSALTDSEMVSVFSDMTAKLWQIHPFREGNTRTIIAYATIFATQNIRPINSELLSKNAAYLRDALVMASLEIYSEPQYLENIFSEALCGSEFANSILANAESQKYKFINGYDVSKYHSTDFETYYDKNNNYINKMDI